MGLQTYGGNKENYQKCLIFLLHIKEKQKLF